MLNISDVFFTIKFPFSHYIKCDIKCKVFASYHGSMSVSHFIFIRHNNQVIPYMDLENQMVFDFFFTILLQAAP